MPDIIASLLKTLNDETGPQHKKHGLSEFEWSEGSDGAIHSKIVDQHGNPIDSREITNFPENYPDAAALTELQSLKNKQEEIDNKIQMLVTNQGKVEFPETQSVADSGVLSAIQNLQQENAEIKQMMNSILERLDGTFDTQLTGSNVEQDVNVVSSLKEHFSISNLTIAVGATFNSDHYESVGSLIKLAMRRERGVEVRIGFFNKGSIQYVYSEEPERIVGRLPIYTKYEVPSFGGDFRIELINNTDEDITIEQILLTEEL